MHRLDQESAGGRGQILEGGCAVRSRAVNGINSYDWNYRLNHTNFLGRWPRYDLKLLSAMLWSWRGARTGGASWRVQYSRFILWRIYLWSWGCYGASRWPR